MGKYDSVVKDLEYQLISRQKVIENLLKDMALGSELINREAERQMSRLNRLTEYEVKVKESQAAIELLRAVI